jgi:DNA repair exonuclease SbcCD ATPase subunit
LKYKNFLSSGDNFVEIDFKSHKSTLIVGLNGSGKSTMLDALSFVLFGKAHRNINKPQLCNSINKKNCVVEVFFTIGETNFRIIRGLKPTLFEIWKDGELLNQSSHTKDYQKILEQNILKLNHKSFHQIVVLGSSSFTPFMQLPTPHRRSVIEDLLDINIFTKMNILVKEKISILKERIRNVDFKLEILKNKVTSQRKYIRDMSKVNKDEITEKQNRISDIETTISDVKDKNQRLLDTITEDPVQIDSDIKTLSNKLMQLAQYKAKFESSLKSLHQHTTFYTDNLNCPTCTQDIDPEFRKNKLHVAEQKIVKLNDGSKQALDNVSKLKIMVENHTQTLNTIRTTQSNITNNNNMITEHQKQIQDLNDDIERIMTRDEDMQKATADLTKMNDETQMLNDEKYDINDDYSYNIIMTEMLKDTGIKTKILKQYIPVINKLVNNYLHVLDFFVYFYLDENFQEVIKSRHRDEFSYSSFSEGEKQRIDLALLFTWRQIARMKNSVATNILILDETFDSSLDFDGVENLMKILYTLDDDTNVFVISHKGEILENKFQRKLEFEKIKNFSLIKE